MTSRLPNPLTRSTRRVAAWLGALCLSVAGPAAAHAQLIPKEKPEEIKGLELTNKLGTQIPLDLSFTDSSTGKPVTLRDIVRGPAGTGAPAAPGSLAAAPPDGLPRGQRPVLLMMMYFRCPILCPKMHQEVADLLGRLDFRVGRDFDVIMVSFDPLDTPREAEHFKTNGFMLYTKPVDEYTRAGWHYLTGSAENARSLADSIGFSYRYLPESQQYSHGPALFLLTPEGKLSRVFPNFEISERERTSEVRMALVDASQGRIGTVFDQLMLFCYRYDPREGSYVLQAVRVMQIGGVITVISLGGLVGWLIRGELRKRTHLGASAARDAGGNAGTRAGSGTSIIQNAAVGAP
jgi:protein SCO1/2